MNKEDKLIILKKIENPGVIPVIRVNSTKTLFTLIDALIAGGVSCVELTMTIPGAVKILGKCRNRYDGKIVIGMGTVLEKAQAKEVIAAGAEFMVSPLLAFDALEEARKFNVPFMMGAFSPTEIYQADKAGADYVKIFPVNILGLQYIKDIKGPLPYIKFIPTGGIILSQVNDFINAGVSAIGVGSDLVNKKCIEQGDWQIITNKAAQFSNEIMKVRSRWNDI